MIVAPEIHYPPCRVLQNRVLPHHTLPLHTDLENSKVANTFGDGNRRLGWWFCRADCRRHREPPARERWVTCMDSTGWVIILEVLPPSQLLIAWYCTVILCHITRKHDDCPWFYIIPHIALSSTTLYICDVNTRWRNAMNLPIVCPCVMTYPHGLEPEALLVKKIEKVPWGATLDP